MPRTITLSGTIVAAAVCLLILTATSFAQRPVQGSKPVETSFPDVLSAFCSSVSRDYRICKVRTSEDCDAEFRVQFYQPDYGGDPYTKFWLLD